MYSEAMFQLIPIYEIKRKTKLLMYTEAQLQLIPIYDIKE